MKILLAHNYYQQAGGEDIVFQSEKRLLESAGHEVRLAIMDNATIKKMSAIEIGIRSIWNKDGYNLIYQQIQQFQPDLVHFHNTFPLISPAGYDAAYDCGIPVVQTLHNFRLICLIATFVRDGKLCDLCVGKTPPYPGVYYRCYHDSFPASATVAAMLTIHRLRKTWQRRVDAFITLSEFSRQQFIKIGLQANKLFVKPNFAWIDHPLEKNYSDREYFLFIGRLSPEKGISILLDAVKDSELPVKIVGSGPLENEVLQKINSGGMKNCDFLGQVTHSQAIDLIRGAIALVIPSIWYEGFPMIIAEAFSQGTPIIASDLGVMAEILRDEKCGLKFQPADTSSLINLLYYAWHHPEVMLKKGLNAENQYVRHYSSKSNYEQLIKVYKSVSF
jgi:glycosyltransferase involved in cell wall biosynthesis